MKFVVKLLFVLFTLSSLQVYSQERSLGSGKKHARKKSGRGGGPSNSFIDRKAKNKPSAKLGKSVKKEERHQKRAYKRQVKRSKKGAGKRGRKWSG